MLKQFPQKWTQVLRPELRETEVQKSGGMMSQTMRHAAGAVWAAMRALFEGAEPTPELLAGISGRAAATIKARANREGWQALAPNARLLRLQRLIDEKTARLEGLKPETGASNKALLEVVRIEMASIGLLEKLAEAAGTLETRQEIASARDEEIGAILERINNRIIELARDYAAELAGNAAECGGGAGGQG
jgi:hypothetical protein